MHDLDTGLDKAVEFLLAHQDADGAWRENFNLRAGYSGSWTTGYVGIRLRRAQDRIHDVVPALKAATAWLSSQQQEDGGWDYNHNYRRNDSDSTGHAAVLINRVAGVHHDRAAQRLLDFQREDGGIASFDGCDADDSWGCSHPDVTPIAVQALMTASQPDMAVVRRALAYLATYPRSASLWPSYWWTTPLYSTLFAVELLTEHAYPYDSTGVLEAAMAVEDRSTFHLALRARLLKLLGDNRSAEADVSELLTRQLHDGGWDAEPIMRVTEQDAMLSPSGHQLRGRLEFDRRRLFTTATVLDALVSVSGTTDT
ncbi:prenyltransferase/squalene oxidase repeat-containing protein [Streptomyces sp. NPDC005805]|uniref:prenyltransferase/squalene oxidase repeat-containing protein n=1 Tax=Streptomyces sp. NPDC005805 TaxID=3157068 RepID=UPI0033EA42A0